jgi:hypothetical protein
MHSAWQAHGSTGGLTAPQRTVTSIPSSARSVTTRFSRISRWIWASSASNSVAVSVRSACSSRESNSVLSTGRERLSTSAWPRAGRRKKTTSSSNAASGDTSPSLCSLRILRACWAMARRHAHRAEEPPPTGDTPRTPSVTEPTTVGGRLISSGEPPRTRSGDESSWARTRESPRRWSPPPRSVHPSTA